MKYAYYPGCSLKGSAKALDDGLKKVFSKAGIDLTEIPDWNCCGAQEFGDVRDLRSLSNKVFQKAERISKEIISPCPLCMKNLKESLDNSELKVLHPLDLLDSELLGSIKIKRDLRNLRFTPYYGCMLLRPKETRIKNVQAMEDIIGFFGGTIYGSEVRDLCCGGNRFFVDKDLAHGLTRKILDRSCERIVVFCPLCHMILGTFSGEKKVLYLTDVLLYVLGERERI